MSAFTPEEKRMNAIRKAVLGSNRWTEDRRIFDSVWKDVLDYFDKNEPRTAAVLREGWPETK